MNTILRRFFIGFLFTGIIIVIVNLWPTYDDTDAPNSHSGLTIYIDNKTQLQYLGALGGLTPRIASDGHHMKVGE